MKHRSALGLHLQRFEAPTKELNFRKKRTHGDLDHLHQLYNDTLTRITTRPTDTDSQSTQLENQERQNGVHQDDIVTNISKVYEQNRRRLELLMAFLGTKSKDLLKIKRTFQKEFPLTRARRNVGGQGGQLSSDQYHEQKDQAVQKMTRNLGKFSEELHRRINAEKSRHELEDLLSELNLLDARSPKRNLVHAKPPVIISPRRKSSVSKPKRTSSISKERYLNKAKRAAKKAPRSSKETSNSTSSVSDHNSTQESASKGDGSGSESNQDKNSMKMASNASTESQVSVSDIKVGHTHVIQVQEVTSSVQDRSKLDCNSSAGDSSESSIMTSSTVSAMLGDSSLQLSADNSDDKGASGSDSSTDNVIPVLTEDDKEKPSANEDPATKRRESLLLRPRSSEGSRYLLFGINPAPEGKDQASTKHNLPRTGRAPQTRSLTGPYNTQHSPYKRWQAPYHHTNPWYHGHYQPYQHFTSRHSHSPHPQYRSTSDNYTRRLKPDKPPRHPSKSPPKTLLKRVNEDLPKQGFSSGSSSEEQTKQASPEGASRFSRTESSGSTRKSIACWPEGLSRGGFNVSSGPSDGGKAYVSPSPTPEDETNGCSKDVQVKSGHEESGEARQGAVRVRLITMEQVHKHRGPGLLDNNTQADSFWFSKEKTLEELTELVHKRMKLTSTSRVRLWLFEENQEGLFLPRHLLHGTFAHRTVGSLNQDTITLFVQTTDTRERVFSFDHNKVRFVFVKAPQCDTGEFVVKGHDHIDVSKATRAIIQVLKKKFLPRCPSSVKLYVESEGKTMYCVTHGPVSTFQQDTEGRGRHGDILLLLEEFIDQHTSVAHQSAPLNNAGPNGNHVSYPQPHHNPPPSNDSAEASSGSEAVWSSDDQADSVDCPADPVDCPEDSEDCPVDSVDCAASFPVLDNDNSDSGDDQHKDKPVQDDGGGESKGHAAAPSAWPKKGKTMTTRNFIISQDSSTSGSDESVSSPMRGIQLLDHPNIVRGRRFMQWNLTGDYFARFNRIQEENEDLCENGQAEKAVVDETEDSGRCGDYDALNVSSRLEIVEYESLVVSSVHSDATSQDVSGMTSHDASCETSHTSGMTSHDASGMTSHDASCVSGSVASERTGEMTDQCSACDIYSIPPSPGKVTGGDSGPRSGHSSVAFSSSQTSAGQDNVLVAMLNLNGNHNPSYPCNGDALRNLNPVATPLTPRTLLRLKNDFMQKRLVYRKSIGDGKGAVVGKVALVERDNCGTSRSTPPSVPSTPNTPRSNGHLTSDEDLSVYYTPGHGLAFPEPRPKLQSSEIPLNDLNTSQSPGPLHPDQISAITNRSSSFMAIRVSRQSPGRLHQISAIPNISSSFMEIPPQLQLHHFSLPGHSTSLSGLHQRHSSSCQPEPSFQAATSPRSPRTDGDTSHLQANAAVALPPRPTRPSRQMKSGNGVSHDARKNSSASRPQSASPTTGLQSQRTGEGQHGSHEASGVQQEDPAIMGVGKQVMVMAQKSSLNANAVEFVPKGKSVTFSPQQVNSKPTGKVDKAVSPAGPSAAPFPYGGHPLINKLYNHAMYQQQGGSFPPDRTSTALPKPAAFSGFPINRPLPGSMYNTRQPSNLQTTRPRPPILVSLTDGAQTSLSPKPRHDPARHVTFADQPARPGRPGARPLGRHMNGAGHIHVQPRTQYGIKPPHSASTEGGSSSRQDTLPPLRRKIGSGRFNEGPRRHLGELRKSAQRENALYPQTNPAYNFLSRDYRSPSPSFPAHGRRGNGNHWYGEGHHAEYIAPRHFRRDVFSADHPPMPPRHVDANYHPRRHPNFIPHPHPHNQYFPPEDRWYSQGPPYAPPHPNSYKSHRSSHTHPKPEEYTRLQSQRNRLNAVSGGMDFRFRRPIRTQCSSNSSSDQSDSSFQNERQSNQRFHNVSRPVSEKERENGFNSGSLHSENSKGGRDISTEKLVPESRDTGSGEDSEGKSSQTSNASQQCLRARRGYIQLGLSDATRPSYTRTVSDP